MYLSFDSSLQLLLLLLSVSSLAKTQGIFSTLEYVSNSVYNLIYKISSKQIQHNVFYTKHIFNLEYEETSCKLNFTWLAH